jgi:hypothetical protein
VTGPGRDVCSPQGDRGHTPQRREPTGASRARGPRQDSRNAMIRAFATSPSSVSDPTGVLTSVPRCGTEAADGWPSGTSAWSHEMAPGVSAVVDPERGVHDGPESSCHAGPVRRGRLFAGAAQEEPVVLGRALRPTWSASQPPSLAEGHSTLEHGACSGACEVAEHGPHPSSPMLSRRYPPLLAAAPAGGSSPTIRGVSSNRTWVQGPDQDCCSGDRPRAPWSPAVGLVVPPAPDLDRHSPTPNPNGRHVRVAHLRSSHDRWC